KSFLIMNSNGCCRAVAGYTRRRFPTCRATCAAVLNGLNRVNMSARIGGNMRLKSFVFFCLLALVVAGVSAQDPNAQHFAKDGLSFDYPKTWQVSDQSTQQMQ